MIGRIDRISPPFRVGSHSALGKLLGHLTRDVGEIRDHYQSPAGKVVRRQRKLVLLGVLGLGNAALMLLRQTRVLARLPDLPHRAFDANAVTTSPKAYEFGIPDGAPASLLYSLILVLATYGGTPGLRRLPVLEPLLKIATMVNALAAYQYILNMFLRQKKLCLYCLFAAGINTALLPPAWAEEKT
jgi:uncharacterized membrane protein